MIDVKEFIKTTENENLNEKQLQDTMKEHAGNAWEIAKDMVNSDIHLKSFYYGINIGVLYLNWYNRQELEKCLKEEK